MDFRTGDTGFLSAVSTRGRCLTGLTSPECCCPHSSVPDNPHTSVWTVYTYFNFSSQSGHMFWGSEWPGLVETCLFIFACVAGSLSSTDVSFISNGKDQRFVFCVILLSCSSIGPTVQRWYWSSRTTYMSCPCNKAKM